MTRSLLILGLLFPLACDHGPDGPDGSTGEDTMTGSSDTGGDTSSGADASTADEPASSTGDASSSTGGVDETCFGEQCAGQCGAGLLCAPHPDNASLAVCTAPCTLDGPPCALEVDGCGEAPLGECRVGFSWTLLCFPLLCTGSAECESGECVDGRCV